MLGLINGDAGSLDYSSYGFQILGVLRVSCMVFRGAYVDT